MILYFSATGNSEYVAKNIAYINNDQTVDMSFYLKSNQIMDLTSDSPYLVVCPIYISTLPTIIIELLKKSKLNGNKNIYFIMTCAGSGVSGADAFIRPLVKDMGLIYRGVEHLSMPQNYLMFFTVKNKEENDIKMQEAISKIPALADKIKNNLDFNMDKVDFMHKISIKPVIWMFDKFFIKPKKFYIKDGCISCSICVNSCPLNNIKLIDGKPIWGKSCVHCTACINRCPKKVIEYGKKTLDKNRYVAIKFKEN
ncbi:MAG: EFR1 family ferrodoxin [Acholeplasmatales bacterium]|nr:EFR1 family ferrodoxin [Acholeplasmatales bacterium]